MHQEEHPAFRDVAGVMRDSIDCQQVRVGLIHLLKFSLLDIKLNHTEAPYSAILNTKADYLNQSRHRLLFGGINKMKREFVFLMNSVHGG